MGTYKIGEFAKKIGVSVSTLRRWDKEGLLIANRSPLGTRFYTDEHYQNYMNGKDVYHAINEISKNS